LSAEEKVSGVSKWKQTFVFDRYGNRTLDAANTTTLVASNTVTNPSVNEANNRLNDYTYDAAGNLTVDAENKRFVYDAENHQTKLFLGANNSNSHDAVYQYDGEGRRVVKISAHEKTVFVYDGGAQLVAEYTAWTAPDPAPLAQVSYLTQDHLGSTRIITNTLGQVIKRSDYMAYGDEVITANRSSANGYEQPSETRKGYIRKRHRIGPRFRAGEILQPAARKIHERRSADRLGERQRPANLQPLHLRAEFSV